MKRNTCKWLLVTIAFFPAMVVNSQAYKPLDLSESATWSHTECGYDPDWSAIYKLRVDGDTMVGNKLYKKIYYQAKMGPAFCTNCEFIFNIDSAALFALVREEIPKRKIYFVYPYLCDKEWLAYDFNIAGVGAPILGFCLIFSTQTGFETAGLSNYQLQVNAIDSICVDGTYRKRYFFDEESGGNKFHLPEFWIEGVGSTFGLLVQGYGAPGWKQELYCLANKDGSVFFDTTNLGGCIPASSLDCSDGDDCSPIPWVSHENKPATLHIHPNPAQEILVIEYPVPGNSVSITIYNSIGKPVYQKPDFPWQGVISLSIKEWPSGIYYIVFEGTDFRASSPVIKL